MRSAHVEISGVRRDAKRLLVQSIKFQRRHTHALRLPRHCQFTQLASQRKACAHRVCRHSTSGFTALIPETCKALVGSTLTQVLQNSRTSWSILTPHYRKEIART